MTGLYIHECPAIRGGVTHAEAELAGIYNGLKSNREDHAAAVLFGAFWAAVAFCHGEELTAEEMASAILSMQCPEAKP